MFLKIEGKAAMGKTTAAFLMAAGAHSVAICDCEGGLDNRIEHSSLPVPVIRVEPSLKAILDHISDEASDVLIIDGFDVLAKNNTRDRIEAAVLEHPCMLVVTVGQDKGR